MQQRPQVLVFSANQVGNPLGLDDEWRAVRRALGDAAVVQSLPAARAEELVADLSRHRPVVVHFMGHGSPEGLMLAYGRDDYRRADGKALRAILEGRGVELVVLNSCYSAEQANQIAASVGVVVGTPDALEDEAGAKFASAFYGALRHGATVDEATRDGAHAAQLQHGVERFEVVGDGTWRLPLPDLANGESSKEFSVPWPKVAAGAVVLAMVALFAVLLVNREPAEQIVADSAPDSIEEPEGPSDTEGTATVSEVREDPVDSEVPVEAMIAAAEQACSATRPDQHGSTVEVLGIDYEVVDAATFAAERSRSELDGGGFFASAVTDPSLVLGTDAGDELAGGPAGDILCGFDGDDRLLGKEGDDVLVGGPGVDRMAAETGNDIVVGDAEDSELTGGDGDDWCSDVSAAGSTCERRS